MFKEKEMYQIILGDINCPACTSGVVRYFTDDINEFKEEWMKIENDTATKERFLRSLNGEIVTDYYSDDPELNIVQKKQVEILGEKTFFTAVDRVSIYNSYGYDSQFRIRRLIVKRKYINCDGEYLRIERYVLDGIAKYLENKYDHDKSEGCEHNHGKNIYESPSFYGNPIIKHTNKPENWMHSTNFDLFEDKMRSICYLVTECFDNEDELLEDLKKDRLTDKDLEILLIDLVGEAG